MQHKALFLLALACLYSASATAQWQWIDKDGRKVFSDRPPPQEVAPEKILKQPAARATSAAAQSLPAAQPPAMQSSAPPAAAPKPDKAARELEDKKAKAEAAQAQRQQAEDKARAEQQARQRADNCARARQAVSTLASGMPLAHTNAQGERGFMDETTRATELRRAQDIVASDCK
ncbi:DUF4124 domain-containing protein [Melaminivora sp.]